jgi:hypothetical protein
MDDNYIKNLLEQTLSSYHIIKGLKDKPGYLVILKEELGKIQGLLQVVINKIERSENISDSITEFLDVSRSYLKDYSFYHEIDTVAKLYSDDSHRIKGIRLAILSALEKSGMILKISDLLQKL